MHKIKNQFAALFGIMALVGLIAARSPVPSRGQGQGGVGAQPTQNVNVVNTPTVGISPAANTVRLDGSDAPIPVREVKGPFQRFYNLNSESNSLGCVIIDLPAGKITKIETVAVDNSDSAISLWVDGKISPSEFRTVMFPITGGTTATERFRGSIHPEVNIRQNSLEDAQVGDAFRARVCGFLGAGSQLSVLVSGQEQ
jgi:hypothetical protein